MMQNFKITWIMVHLVYYLLAISAGQNHQVSSQSGLEESKEYTFCDDISDNSSNPILMTEGFPVKSNFTFTCFCTLESEYGISAFAECNGTVTFIVAEAGNSGTVNASQYKCKDELENNFIFIGEGKLNRIGISIDPTGSDEEFAFQLHWFGYISNGKRRITLAPMTLSCKKENDNFLLTGGVAGRSRLSMVVLLSVIWSIVLMVSQ